MPHEPSATRRTALRAVALGVPLPVLLAACTDDPATDLTPGASPAATTDTSDDPDLVVVAGVLGEVGALVALLEATRTRHRSLRASLAPALQVHRAQLEAVLATGADDPGPRGRTRVPGRPVAALEAVRRREETARRRLVTHAVDAESGALARLVAAVAAGVAQQQVQLAAVSPTGGGR